MGSNRKLGITIYISGIIILSLLAIIVYDMNHVITVKMNITDVEGANNYTMIGDKAIIEYNGEIYTVDLVEHINTLATLIGIIILLLIIWIIFGLMIIGILDD